MMLSNGSKPPGVPVMEPRCAFETGGRGAPIPMPIPKGFMLPPMPPIGLGIEEAVEGGRLSGLLIGGGFIAEGF
jgi:hypothetical protein